MTPPLSLCLAGAAADTGNLGVQALYASVLGSLGTDPNIRRVSVLDNGWGVRAVDHAFGRFELEHCGARLSRRWYRPESWRHIAFSGRLGGVGNPTARRLRDSAAVLDISGGDSFSDIYGHWRFRAALAPKLAATALGRPLILLPQTYGPFSDDGARAAARAVVLAATAAYSRDDASHEVLLGLLGDDADPDRHRQGVDVAFALQAVDPGPRLGPSMRDELDDASAEQPRIGLNISGLVYNDAAAARRFGLSIDYRSVVRRIVEWFVEQGCTVFLVPHVVARAAEGINAHDDDLRACVHLLGCLDSTVAKQVQIVPATLSAAEAKWVIGRMNWFCGTRMHSTVAALSCGVPTIGIAYSMKTAGVFRTCGQGAEVIEARSSTDGECVARIRDAWHRREAVRAHLADRTAEVRRVARSQLLELVGRVHAAEREPSR